MTPAIGDPQWDWLERAKSGLLALYSADGVVGVEYVVGFVSWGSFAVWMVTATDAERDSLSARIDADPVRHALEGAGFGAGQPEQLTVVVQSQETVDRDYAGSWFYALR